MMQIEHTFNRVSTTSYICIDKSAHKHRPKIMMEINLAEPMNEPHKNNRTIYSFVKTESYNNCSLNRSTSSNFLCRGEQNRIGFPLPLCLSLSLSFVKLILNALGIYSQMWHRVSLKGNERREGTTSRTTKKLLMVWQKKMCN